MTTRRATDRRTTLEKHQDEVIALLLTGTRPVEVAEKYDVARSSVTKFIKRHADRLAALQAVVAKQVEDYAIAHQVNRIARLDHMWDEVSAWVEENGLSEVTVRFDDDGKERSRTIKLRADAMNVLRGLLDDAARETGARSKDGGAHASATAVTIVRVNVPELGI